MATILLIDDDVTLLASLSAQLEEAGYSVVKANEVMHAELSLTEQQPDLVVMEVRINQNAGWDLLSQAASQAPVIVVSANSREEDVVRGIEAGAVDYIAKPYRSNELLARIRLRLGSASRAVGTLKEPASGQAVMETSSAAAPPEASTEPSALPSEAPTEPPAAPPISPEKSNATPAESAKTPEPSDSSAVFMSEAEELALLRSAGDEPPPQHSILSRKVSRDGKETLGERIHAERLRRRVTLVQAENELKIRMSYLQAIEDDKFTLLPRGPLAGQMLRNYATYLGLDVGPIMDEYKRLHATDALVPAPTLAGSRRRRSLPKWLVWIAAIMLALTVSIGGIWYFDPTGFATIENNLRNLIVAPLATVTPTPTLTPTLSPTIATPPTLTPTTSRPPPAATQVTPR
ncbi:MAG: response regulator [Chloroflexales bacterium]|nr:response regulator [Chloroflexales bacterium]